MPYTPTTWVEGVTKLGPTNMNHLETGVSGATTTADAAIAKPASPATNDGLVWNGSTWTNAKLVNANIDPAAAIVYSKLSLAGGIVNNDINASAAIALSKLADPGSGNVVTSAGAGVITAKPPGYEFDYKEVTTDQTSTATTTASATAIVTSNAVTFDGSTIVLIEFYCANWELTVTTQNMILSLYDGATELGMLCVMRGGSVATQENGPLRLARRLTPSAAAHTYSIRAAVSGASTATFKAAAGTTGAYMPMFTRITKVA